MQSAMGLQTTRPFTPICPDMIKYYLSEEPILPNVPTYQLSDPEARGMCLKYPAKW